MLIDCVPYPNYPIVEADCLGDMTPGPSGQCLFFYNTLYVDPKDTSKYQVAYTNRFTQERYLRTIDPSTAVVSWNGDATIGAQLAPSAKKTTFTAFCAVNASTMNWLGTEKACYCGPGTGTYTAPGTSAPMCIPCAAGFYKGIGGAAGSGDASRNEKCTPCEDGFASAAGQEACAPTCPAGTALQAPVGANPSDPVIPTATNKACLPTAGSAVAPVIAVSFRCSSPDACGGSLKAISSATAGSGPGGRQLQVKAGGKKTKFTAKVQKGTVATGAAAGKGKAKVAKKERGPTLPVPQSGKGVASTGGTSKSPAARLAAAKLQKISSVPKVVVPVIFPSSSASKSPGASPSRTPTLTPSTTPKASGASFTSTPTPTPTVTRTNFPSATAQASRSKTPTQSTTPSASRSPLAPGASPSTSPSGTPAPSASPASVAVALTLPAGAGAALTVATLPAEVGNTLIEAMSSTLGVPRASVTIADIIAVQTRRLAATVQLINFRKLLTTTGMQVVFNVLASSVASSTVVAAGAGVSTAQLAAAVQNTMAASIASGSLSNTLAATSVLSDALLVSRASLNSPSSLAASASYVAAASPTPSATPSYQPAAAITSPQTEAIIGGVLGVRRERGRARAQKPRDCSHPFR